MTAAEADAFLATLRRSGHLATARANGTPQVAPVWFWWQRPVVWVVTYRDSARVANMLRESRVALSVDANAFPAVGVVLYGRATLEELGDGEIVRRIVERYRPHEDVESFVRRYQADPNRVLVRIDVDREITWNANPPRDEGDSNG
jgi:PPOX class probable F420-dependent enzyme